MDQSRSIVSCTTITETRYILCFELFLAWDYPSKKIHTWKKRKGNIKFSHRILFSIQFWFSYLGPFKYNVRFFGGRGVRRRTLHIFLKFVFFRVHNISLSIVWRKRLEIAKDCLKQQEFQKWQILSEASVRFRNIREKISFLKKSSSLENVLLRCFWCCFVATVLQFWWTSEHRW